jgi:trans-L-3-hydroxyproline dehydratase
MTVELPDFEPDPGIERVETVEMHTGGEPLRVVTGGFPPIEGETLLEKRQYAEKNLDDYRTALMWEPRGHADMYGALPVESDDASADVGVLFVHNDGYSTMCGHGILALGTLLPRLDGYPSDEVRIQTPAGVVTARPEWTGDRVERVAFENVPSFVVARNETVAVPGVGDVDFDVAFGGAFYAFCDAGQFDVSLDGDHFLELVDLGRRIKRSVAEAVDVTHPEADDLGFLYGTIFTGPPRSEGADSRNVCVFAEGEVDRCPTGTGVSARLALRRDDGDPFVVESIVGSQFSGRVLRECEFHGYDAVVPEITGSAHVTGRSEFLLDPADPFEQGFILR